VKGIPEIAWRSEGGEDEVTTIKRMLKEREREPTNLEPTKFFKEQATETEEGKQEAASYAGDTGLENASGGQSVK